MVKFTSLCICMGKMLKIQCLIMYKRPMAETCMIKVANTFSYNKKFVPGGYLPLYDNFIGHTLPTEFHSNFLPDFVCTARISSLSNGISEQTMQGCSYFRCKGEFISIIHVVHITSFYFNELRHHCCCISWLDIT